MKRRSWLALFQMAGQSQRVCSLPLMWVRIQVAMYSLQADPGVVVTGQCAMLIEKKKIVYGDSLAWSVPVDLLPRLEQFIEHIYGECLSDYSVFECHTSSNVSTEREHKCGFSCASQYPLQTCSDICGVVVLIMAVYACTARSFFSHITTSGQL